MQRLETATAVCCKNQTVGVQSIVINPSVCQCVSVSQSVREHISGTARLIFTTFLCRSPVTVARFSSSGVALRFMDDVTFGCNGRYGVGWLA